MSWPAVHISQDTSSAVTARSALSGICIESVPLAVPLPALAHDWNADIEREGSDFVVPRNSRQIGRVQFDAAEIVGNQRDHGDKSRAAVVGLTVHDCKGAAHLPLAAHFKLVTQRRKLRPGSPRILECAQFGKCSAPLVIDQLVVQAESRVDLIVQVLAVNGCAIRMVREPVYVEVERVQIESEIRRCNALR